LTDSAILDILDTG